MSATRHLFVESNADRDRALLGQPGAAHRLWTQEENCPAGDRKLALRPVCFLCFQDFRHTPACSCVLSSVFARGRFMRTQQSTNDRENLGQRGRVHERARGTRTGVSTAGARPAQVRGVRLSLEREGAPHPHSRAPGRRLRVRRGVCTRDRRGRSNTDYGLIHFALGVEPVEWLFCDDRKPRRGWGDQTTVSDHLASPPGGGTVDPFLSLGPLRHARGRREQAVCSDACACVPALLVLGLPAGGCAVSRFVALEKTPASSSQHSQT